MLDSKKAFSGFSVDNLEVAEKFYSEILGINVEQVPKMGLRLHLPGTEVFIYPKPNHQPATFTVLNFMVSDIDTAVDYLTAKGVKFEHYPEPMKTDDKGIFRSTDSTMGPSIAWFTDPAGNILSVIQEK